MRNLRHVCAAPGLLSILLLACLAGPTAAQETQDTTQLPGELRAVRATLSAAFGKLDGAAAAAHFADEGVIDFQGQVISGPEAVGGWFGEMFGGMSGLRSGTPTFVVADGEVREQSTYTVLLTDGSEQFGTSETVWKQQADGSWKVARLVVM